MQERTRPQPANPPAVLLGGDATAVPVARRLRGLGADVYALGSATGPVRSSRFCTRYENLGNGPDTQQRWLEWLRSERLGAVILPCSDDGVELVARNRAELVGLGYTPVEANDDVMLAMIDKARTYELAQQIGVPAPRSLVITNEQDVESAVASFEYPCGVKPLHSHVAQQRELGAKLLVADNPAELRSTLERMNELEIEAMVTEIVPGPDQSLYTYYVYLDEQGDPIQQITTRKLRQYPIHFGITSYMIAEWHPDVAELGLRFVRGIGLRGMAQVEFKRSSDDGLLKLIECNHRFVAFDELLQRSGFDVPSIAYNRSLGRPAPEPDSIRYGTRLWFPFDDLRAQRQYRRAGELSLGRWLLSLMHRLHVPVFKLNDPGPSIVFVIDALRRSIGRLFRRRA